MFSSAWIRMRKHAAVFFLRTQIQQFYFLCLCTRTVIYVFSTFCVSVLELIYMCVCSHDSLV